MEIPFVSSDEVPVPPTETRIRSVDVMPLADGRRVRLTMVLTPFLQAPTIEIRLLDEARRAVSEATIVESPEARSAVTLHLRGDCQPGTYHASVAVEYPEIGRVAETEVDFSLAEAASASALRQRKAGVQIRRS